MVRDLWLVQRAFCKFVVWRFCTTLAGHVRRRFRRGILTHSHEGVESTAQRVEHHPLEAAFAALLANDPEGGGFYPSVLEKGTRTEQAVNIALAEMYVQSVSTRKVTDILVKLLGPEVSKSST